MAFLTGVSVDFAARHTDPMMGEGEHAHVWRITTWFPAEPFRDGRALLGQLRMVLDGWPDETGVLPGELWSAEAMAKALMAVLNNCVGVDIDRAEGFHVRLRA